MGIRYYAQSIDQMDYDHIKAGPCPTCGTRPHPRDRDYDEPEPDSLDLDKSWHYLQRILASEPPRPAAALVAGSVRNTDTGWIAYQGIIAPESVETIAADLTKVTAEEVKALFQRDGDWEEERSQGDFEYVQHYLERAVTFTKRVATAGLGVVYYIG